MPAPNRILREIVDIHCFGEPDGLAIRRRVEDLCAQPLTRAIDELIASCDIPEDQLVSIERLQVDVTGINSRQLEQDLIPGILSALRQELAATIGPPHQIHAHLLRPVRRSLFDEFLFFLARGYLPWSTSGDATWSAAASEALANLEAADHQRLMAILKRTDARQRLARHFPEPTLKQILPALRTDDEWQLLLDDVETLLAQRVVGQEHILLRERWLRLLLDAAVLPERVDLFALARKLVSQLPAGEVAPKVTSTITAKCQFLRQSLQLRHKTQGIPAKPDAPIDGTERLPAAPAIPIANTEQTNERADQETDHNDLSAQDEAAIYVRNGGLVILAPYLPALFSKLNLTDGERVVNISTALLLLHFLVFGSEECAEWDFALGKLLCGIPLEQAIETPPPLSAKQKEEANCLLEAVVVNWPALKNTSPDGLRSAFLQREGALRRKDGVWYLSLTRTSFDVLLDRLPWTISMIQLPWMPWLLQTDWAD